MRTPHARPLASPFSSSIAIGGCGLQRPLPIAPPITTTPRRRATTAAPADRGRSRTRARRHDPARPRRPRRPSSPPAPRNQPRKRRSSATRAMYLNWDAAHVARDPAPARRDLARPGPRAGAASRRQRRPRPTAHRQPHRQPRPGRRHLARPSRRRGQVGDRHQRADHRQRRLPRPPADAAHHLRAGHPHAAWLGRERMAATELDRPSTARRSPQHRPRRRAPATRDARAADRRLIRRLMGAHRGRCADRHSYTGAGAGRSTRTRRCTALSGEVASIATGNAPDPVRAVPTRPLPLPTTGRRSAPARRPAHRQRCSPATRCASDSRSAAGMPSSSHTCRSCRSSGSPPPWLPAPG